MLAFVRTIYLAGIYLFKINNGNIKMICEIYAKSIKKTPERCRQNRSGVFIFNFEQISQIAWLFPLLTLNK